ncbi:MAG TPA: hypothetical protein VK678_24930 [Bradyrhizobium sp.]|nr:hypothetical protein [Bradyrhizobium sp.]
MKFSYGWVVVGAGALMTCVGITPAAAGYFAWGCFRYFCCPVPEASDRT